MRIVSLLPSATEIVFALGLGDELVGGQPGVRLPAGRRRRAGRDHRTQDFADATSREIHAAIDDAMHGGARSTCSTTTRSPPSSRT